MANLKDIARLAKWGTREIFLVPHAEIVVPPDFNVRDYSLGENIDHVDNLASSIAARGILEPLTVKVVTIDGKDIIRLHHGESRYRAAPIAVSKYGADPELLENIPCQAARKNDNDVDLIVDMLATRNMGKPLTQFEKAIGYKRLINMGLKASEIARRSGVKPNEVSHLLTLAGADHAVQEMVREGDVSASTAITAIKEHGDAATAKLEDARVRAHKEGKKKVTPRLVERAKTTIDPKRRQEMMNDCLKVLQAIASGKYDGKEAKELAKACLERCKEDGKKTKAA